MPVTYADPSAHAPRLDRAIGAGGRLAAGLAAALGAASPLHWHLAGRPDLAPHALGASWMLVGVAAWASGARRRSLALGLSWLGILVGLSALAVRAAGPIDTALVLIGAVAVLVHERDVNAP